MLSSKQETHIYILPICRQIRVNSVCRSDPELEAVACNLSRYFTTLTRTLVLSPSPLSLPTSSTLVNGKQMILVYYISKQKIINEFMINN